MGKTRQQAIRESHRQLAAHHVMRERWVY